MARGKAKKKHNLQALPPQTDAAAPLDNGVLLTEAQRLQKLLAQDLLERADGSQEVTNALKARHREEVKNNRTADGYKDWRRRLTGQVASAWILSGVFVRVLEDKGLLKRNRIAGEGAKDSQKLFFEIAPSLTEREYLLTVFRELSNLPAGAELFDPRHNPVWLLGPSAEGAKKLLEVFRTPGADAPALRFGQSDTRYLGDLYQDLDEDVRKRFALLQTPKFVESFILDRTLERAVEKFGLNETTIIDPTCGSGHFLLGAFDRIYEHRLREEPGLDPRQAARMALDVIAGADINPYAVAIARFRLTLAFIERTAYRRLADAPRLPLHLVVADSLLHNPHLEQLSFMDREGQSAEAWEGDPYSLEDEKAAREVLHKQYSAVVGNPPYITVKDKVLRDRYRALYSSAYREYSLSVPFMERFFQLARTGGFVGKITANSFMKRELGKKVIEEYLPKVNLDLVVNTSGAYIPGHGTPTVLLFGTSDPPKGSDVLTVLAKRGEPTTPEDPDQGLVWRSIADHWNEMGFENDFISISRVARATFGKHPWSLGGGGAAELKELIEKRAGETLAKKVSSIGFMCITKQDDVFSMPLGVFERHAVEDDWLASFVVGEHIRDWSINSDTTVFFPYHLDGQLRKLDDTSKGFCFLWAWRTILESRAVFGGKNFRQAGRVWWEYGQIPSDRIQGDAIAFAFVATHNHFVLDRGGKVFNRSAPIIKLEEGATEEDHLALLAYLNSSTACFWMKQVFFPKYGAVKADHPDPARNFYEFAGTGMKSLPVPDYRDNTATVVLLARELTEAATRRSSYLNPSRLVDALRKTENRDGIERVLEDAWLSADRERRRMVFLQEEIDWLTYVAFGLVDNSVVAISSDYVASSCLARGQRAFEPDDNRMSLVRKDGELLPADKAEVETEAPPKLSDSQSNLRKARRSVINNVSTIALMETTVYKRLWRDSEQNETEHEYRARFKRDVCVAASLAMIEERLSVGKDVATLRSLLHGKEGETVRLLVESTGFDIETVVNSDSVPYLPAHIYKPTGLEKRTAWEETWALQRREDAGEDVGTIPVPPKYASNDYQRPTYWRLRGKLDVPKERFIAYPGCESDEDGEPVFGWAGWNHSERALALGKLYFNRKLEEGWQKERLTPMLAGLLELLPWLKQWHTEPADDFGGESPAAYFEKILEGECHELGVTHGDLRAWRPEKKTGRRKRK